ncbi:MAG: DUF2252 domain-containing protein [Silanimonas sp.]
MTARSDVDALARGRDGRKATPRSALGRAALKKRDAVALLEASHAGRVPELKAIRYGRMLADPFAFYRGGAGLMAQDLAGLPRSPVQTQLCGDAHLNNFGLFASPERTLLFDINDFDESLPGPFDWDLRRLATSFAIAADVRGFDEATQRELVDTLVDAYRDRLARFARMDVLDVWYYRLTAETLLELSSDDGHELEVIRKARRKTSALFAAEATERLADGRWNIRDAPPFVYHDSAATDRELGRFHKHLPRLMADYRASLSSDRRVLLDRYTLHDVAVKVPGVGSVGRRCFIALLVAAGEHPLFLQFKEAADSVLEAPLGRSREAHDGERIVNGQRLMQAASDIFLGWAGKGALGAEFYVRQLRDMKASFDTAAFKRTDFHEYAEACGYALARAHAKAGCPDELLGYIGKGDALSNAMQAFALAYRRRNEADWQALKHAATSGRVPAEANVDD